MKTIIPIPVDAEIYEMIKASAAATGFSMADVMRQGLRRGVPEFTEKMKIAEGVRPPKCLEYLDEYPRATVLAKDAKAALTQKLKKKHANAYR